MRLLVGTDALKVRLVTSPGLVGAEPVLVSALRAAQLRAEAELDTKFSEADYADTFYLDSSFHSGIIPNGMFRLVTKSGLIRKDVALVVEAGGTRNGISDLVPTDSYLVDYERGAVMVDAEYKDKYVRVRYSAGVTDAEIAGGLRDYPWVVEAILGYAPAVLLASQITNRNAEAKDGYAANMAHAMGVLVPYRRRVGFYISPII